MNMTEGFCAIGGPWIHARKEYAICRLERDGSESGPGTVSITVEKPDDGPIKTGTLKLDDVGYYKDIKVFAVPQVAADQIKSLGNQKRDERTPR